MIVGTERISKARRRSRPSRLVFFATLIVFSFIIHSHRVWHIIMKLLVGIIFSFFVFGIKNVLLIFFSFLDARCWPEPAGARSVPPARAGHGQSEGLARPHHHRLAAARPTGHTARGGRRPHVPSTTTVDRHRRHPRDRWQQCRHCSHVTAVGRARRRPVVAITHPLQHDPPPVRWRGAVKYQLRWETEFKKKTLSTQIENSNSEKRKFTKKPSILLISNHLQSSRLYKSIFVYIIYHFRCKQKFTQNNENGS